MVVQTDMFKQRSIVATTSTICSQKVAKLRSLGIFYTTDGTQKHYPSIWSIDSVHTDMKANDV